MSTIDNSTTIISILSPSTHAGAICWLGYRIDRTPAHLVGADCAKVHGRKIDYRECSVCGQDWGEGAISQHQSCGGFRADGSRSYATCLIYLDDGSQLVYN